MLPAKPEFSEIKEAAVTSSMITSQYVSTNYITMTSYAVLNIAILYIGNTIYSILQFHFLSSVPLR